MKWQGYIILISLVASCNPEKARNTLQRLGLKGHVHSLIVTEYKLDSKGLVAGADSELSKSTYEFNNRGYLSSEYNKLAHGHTKMCIYKFDASLRPVLALKYNEDSSLCYKAVFSYDEEGNMREQSQYDTRDSLNLKIAYKYDKKGNRIEECSYWESGKMLNKYCYSYDEKGLETERKFYNADSALVMRAV